MASGRRSGWVERTIKDGKVQIYGHIFRPQSDFVEYDGRLDGERYIFGLYPNLDPDVIGGFEKFACLWGHADLPVDEYGPELVDGRLPWYWWDAE